MIEKKRDPVEVRFGSRTMRMTGNRCVHAWNRHFEGSATTGRTDHALTTFGFLR